MLATGAFWRFYTPNICHGRDHPRLSSYPEWVQSFPTEDTERRLMARSQ